MTHVRRYKKTTTKTKGYRNRKTNKPTPYQQLLQALNLMFNAGDIAYETKNKSDLDFYYDKYNDLRTLFDKIYHP